MIVFQRVPIYRSLSALIETGCHRLRLRLPRVSIKKRKKNANSQKRRKKFSCDKEKQGERFLGKFYTRHCLPSSKKTLACRDQAKHFFFFRESAMFQTECTNGGAR